MPYTITTHPQKARKDGVERAAIRRAVATLFEAREEAAHRIEHITGGDPDYEETYTDAQGCSELGDTFGPLADGTVIEVQPVSMNWIIGVAEDHGEEFGEDAADVEIIDAFNAQQDLI